VPIILVSGYHDPELIDRAAAEHVLAYLVKPIEIASLEAEIAIAVGRFREFQALTKEAAHYRQALSDRKVIERAKGILMRKTGLPEADAFQRLQKLASSNNKKLVDIAGMIVLAEEALTS
jgi:response regulator NasT